MRESRGSDLVLVVARQTDGQDKEHIAIALQTKLGKDKVKLTKRRPDGIVHIKYV